jgi:hypothetical protein
LIENKLADDARFITTSYSSQWLVCHWCVNRKRHEAARVIIIVLTSQELARKTVDVSWHNGISVDAICATDAIGIVRFATDLYIFKFLARTIRLRMNPTSMLPGNSLARNSLRVHPVVHRAARAPATNVKPVLLQLVAHFTTVKHNVSKCLIASTAKTSSHWRKPSQQSEQLACV